MKSIPLELFGLNSKYALLQKKLHHKLHNLASSHIAHFNRYEDRVLAYTPIVFEHFDKNGYNFKQSMTDSADFFITNPHLNVYRDQDKEKFKPIILSELLKILDTPKSELIFDGIADAILKKNSLKYIFDAKDNASKIIAKNHSNLISNIIEYLNRIFGSDESFNFRPIPDNGYHYEEVINQVTQDLYIAGYELFIFESFDNNRPIFSVRIL